MYGIGMDGPYMPQASCIHHTIIPHWVSHTKPHGNITLPVKDSKVHCKLQKINNAQQYVMDILHPVYSQ